MDARGDQRVVFKIFRVDPPLTCIHGGSKYYLKAQRIGITSTILGVYFNLDSIGYKKKTKKNKSGSGAIVTSSLSNLPVF